MKSDPVYVVKNNNLYQYQYDYEISKNISTLMADNILLVSKYFDCKYYYIDIEGRVYYVDKDIVVVLKTIKDIPLRIDNVGLPMLVYSNRIVIFDEMCVRELFIENAPSLNIMYANDYAIFLHYENNAIIYRYDGVDEYISAQHFYMKQNRECIIGNIVNDKYIVFECKIIDGNIEILSKKEYSCGDYQTIGSKFFTDNQNIFIFNDEIKFLFAGGELYSEGNVTYIRRANKLYIETKSYNESIMLDITN